MHGSTLTHLPPRLYVNGQTRGIRYAAVSKMPQTLSETESRCTQMLGHTCRHLHTFMDKTRGRRHVAVCKMLQTCAETGGKRGQTAPTRSTTIKHDQLKPEILDFTISFLSGPTSQNVQPSPTGISRSDQHLLDSCS